MVRVEDSGESWSKHEPSSPHRSTGVEKSCVETTAECSEEKRSVFGRFKLNAP